MHLRQSHRQVILPAIACVLFLALSPQRTLASGTRQLSGPACQPLADAIQTASPDKTSPALPAPEPANREICIQAHIYDVIELTDGTRFLDVCPPSTTDQDCHFLLISLREDREEVGDLRRFRNQDVAIRGTLRRYRGRFGLQISRARQFDGGPEKFRPNPKLLHDFNAQADRMPVRDPNLRASGHHRTFMDRNDREDLPSTKKP